MHLQRDAGRSAPLAAVAVPLADLRLELRSKSSVPLWLLEDRSLPGLLAVAVGC